MFLHELVDGGFLVDDDFGFEIEDLDLDFGQLADTDSRSPLRQLGILQRFFSHVGSELILGFLDTVG